MYLQIHARELRKTFVEQIYYICIMYRKRNRS